MKLKLINKFSEEKMSLIAINKIVQLINKNNIHFDDNNTESEDNIFNLYIDFYSCDCSLYLNKVTKSNTFFFNITKLNVDNNIQKFVFVTLNSFNPNLSVTPKLNINEYKYF